VNQPPQSRLDRFNQLVGTDIGRLNAISDGIFSVGMTLLVLGLAVPELGSAGTETNLLHALRDLAPNVAIYVMSFITLGIFWNGQGSQMGQLTRSDRHYAWMTLAFLFAVTLVPFSTSLLAHNPTLRWALVEYWLNILVLGVTLTLASEYAYRSHLFHQESEREVIRLIRGRVLIAQSLYALATALSVVFRLPTWVSITVIILVQLQYVFAPRIPFLQRF
jgi:TMEM175 potassium channel family protein